MYVGMYEWVDGACKHVCMDGCMNVSIGGVWTCGEKSRMHGRMDAKHVCMHAFMHVWTYECRCVRTYVCL